MQLQDTIVNNDRVACVHTALIAHHHIGGAAEEIGDLSFSLVTPLRSDDDNVGQELGGPKPQICTIREYLRSRVASSKVGCPGAQLPRTTDFSALVSSLASRSCSASGRGRLA